MAELELTLEDLEFFASLTANGGTGALFGHGGQLFGLYPHFERLAAALPRLVAAEKELARVRSIVSALNDGTLWTTAAIRQIEEVLNGGI